MRGMSVGSVMVLVSVIVVGPVFGAAEAQDGRAQGNGGLNPPPVNLRVLPKEIARPQLMQIMQGFDAALGVTCEHCHSTLGRDDPNADFASDVKPPKEMARAMMRMVRDTNALVEKAVASKGTGAVAQVTCAMCHRGAATPIVAAGSPGAPPPRGGGPPAQNR